MDLSLELYNPETHSGFIGRATERDYFVMTGLPETPETIDHAMTWLASQGPAIVGRYGGRVIGAGGVKTMWRGVGEVWMFFEPECMRRRLFALIHEKVKTAFSVVMVGYGYRRLQADVRADNAGARKWAESFGFVAEGRMRRYGANGADFIRYAFLMED